MNPTELLKKYFKIMMHSERQICRYWECTDGEKRCNPEALNTHHLNWFFVKISFSHQLFLVSDIKAFLCQGLYNSIMTQKWFCSITLEDKAPSTTVELSRQQQVHYRWFNVLLVVLVCVKWLS